MPGKSPLIRLAHGRPVAGADVAAVAWAATIPAERRPLVLAAGSERGWFGGCAIVAFDPVECRDDVDMARAASVLDAAMGGRPQLAAAALDYEGRCAMAAYTRGLVLTADGWRAWGDFDGSAALPEAPGGQGPPAKAHALSVGSSLPAAAPLADDIGADLDGPGFGRRVRAVREAVAAGDVYVLNLTYRLAGRAVVDQVTAFAALLARARAEMGAYWCLPGRVLVSASPERFVAVDGRAVEVHPIKGTRPRGATPATDAELAAELAASVKERAEHVMIVDLERNDLGRVCVPGSVGVDPLMAVFATTYCHQMVSRVFGTLAPGTSVAELLEATFPCGSVTGAPKVAAMKAIRELERSPRGAYTGSLVVAVPGALDSSVLIRTCEFDGPRVRWGTGGGITFDSDPAEEYLETLVKAAPFLGDGAPTDALLETCRVVRGRIPLWARHKARLMTGGCGVTLIAAVEATVADAVRGAVSRAYARLRVIVRPDATFDVTVDERRSALDVPGGPACLPVEVGAVPALPRGAAKPAARGFWDDAQARAGTGRQAVLVAADGTVIDGATASVWAVVGRELITPPCPAAVAGVARGLLLETADQLRVAPTVRPLSAEELAGADEVFFTNALAGAVAARGRGGPVADGAAELFAGILTAS